MFGCNYAGFLTDKLIKPIKSYLQSQSIHIGVYIDDGQVISSSSSLCSAQFNFSVLIFELAGWSIQWAKTSSIPSQALVYLGLITDTRDMRYYTPQHKLNCVMQLIDEFLSRKSKYQLITALEFSSFLGKLASMIKSHGNLLRL